MLTKDIVVGGLYWAKVSDKIVTVKVLSIDKRQGWKQERTVFLVENLSTGRKTTFKSAAKFRSVAQNPERMRVKIEINWGYKWMENHYEPTPGKGIKVSCMEHWTNARGQNATGFSFRGCPLGRTSGEENWSEKVATEYAINDFIRYGKPEYLGKCPLTRDMIDVVETTDYRKPEDILKDTEFDQNVEDIDKGAIHEEELRESMRQK